MQNTKLAFLVMIGLAMIDFSIAPSVYAGASAKAHKASPTIAKHVKHHGADKAQPGLKGMAAVYADKFDGHKTASGQRFDQNALTAAHRTLPFGTRVRVTNMNNSKSVEVRITDRGPFCRNRMIDLSASAAHQVGMRKSGIALVKLEIVKEKSSSNS